MAARAVMNPTIFASLVTATILLGGTAVMALALWYARAAQARRLRRRLEPESAPVPEPENEQGSPVLRGIAAQGKALERALDKQGETPRLLAQAGWRSTGQRMAYYSFQLLAPIVLLCGVGLLYAFGPPRFTRPMLLLLFGVMAVILGLLVPRTVVLRRVAAARRARIKREVPLLIHVLALLYESGLSTRQALASLVREGHGVLPELGREIEGVLRQLEAGAELPETLTRLAETLDVPDLTTVLALLRQLDRYGGDVKESLLATLEVIEKRRELELRERVNLISGRMTVVMVLFFFPALLIFVAGPAWIAVLKGLSNAVTR